MLKEHFDKMGKKCLFTLCPVLMQSHTDHRLAVASYLTVRQMFLMYSFERKYIWCASNNKSYVSKRM